MTTLAIAAIDTPASFDTMEELIDDVVVPTAHVVVNAITVRDVEARLAYFAGIVNEVLPEDATDSQRDRQRDALDSLIELTPLVETYAEYQRERLRSLKAQHLEGPERSLRSLNTTVHLARAALKAAMHLHGQKHYNGITLIEAKDWRTTLPQAGTLEYAELVGWLAQSYPELLTTAIDERAFAKAFKSDTANAKLRACGVTFDKPQHIRFDGDK